MYACSGDSVEIRGQPCRLRSFLPSLWSSGVPAQDVRLAWLYLYFLCRNPLYFYFHLCGCGHCCCFSYLTPHIHRVTSESQDLTSTRTLFPYPVLVSTLKTVLGKIRYLFCFYSKIFHVTPCVLVGSVSHSGSWEVPSRLTGFLRGL